MIFDLNFGLEQKSKQTDRCGRRGSNPLNPAWKAGTLPLEKLPQVNFIITFTKSLKEIITNVRLVEDKGLEPFRSACKANVLPHRTNPPYVFD